MEEGGSKGTDDKLDENTHYGAVRSKVNGEENGMEAGMLVYPSEQKPPFQREGLSKAIKKRRQR